jgi:hypothetical protein
MTETIVPAKPDQRIWVLSGESMRQFHLIDVIAWAVAPHGAPIPITPAGRLDKNAAYVLGMETGWMIMPSGQVLSDSQSVGEYLRSRCAA